MGALSFLVPLCAVWWLTSLSLHIGSAAAAWVRPSLRRRYPQRDDRPPVSVVVPVKDMTPGLGAAFDTLFLQSYPEFEVLVSATEKDSAALALARTIAARYPRIPSHFIACDPGTAPNPKINNLATPLKQARHDLVFIKDANIQIGPGQLAETVGYFAGDTGLVAAAEIGRAHV